MAFAGLRSLTTARHLLLVREWPGSSWRSLGAIAELPHVQPKLADSPTQRIPVHAQLARGAALVSLVLLKHRSDEAAFELAHCFRVEDIALVHLLYECFQLIFHGISLFRLLTVSR